MKEGEFSHISRKLKWNKVFSILKKRSERGIVFLILKSESGIKCFQFKKQRSEGGIVFPILDPVPDNSDDC